VCFINPDNITQKQKPEIVTFEPVSTERAELEHFARAVVERRQLSIVGGDEVHNVAVLESIVRSIREQARIHVA
jgi:predicted dehydrogenase